MSDSHHACPPPPLGRSDTNTQLYYHPLATKRTCSTKGHMRAPQVVDGLMTLLKTGCGQLHNLQRSMQHACEPAGRKDLDDILAVRKILQHIPRNIGGKDPESNIFFNPKPLLLNLLDFP